MRRALGTRAIGRGGCALLFGAGGVLGLNLGAGVVFAQSEAVVNGVPVAYSDAPRFAVLMRDGSVRVGGLLGFGEGIVELAEEDADGVPNGVEALPFESVIAVLPVDLDSAIEEGFGALPMGGVPSRTLRSDVRGALLSAELGVLELVDGQRLVGSLDREHSSDDETVRWLLVGGGKAVVPLDRVLRVVDDAARARLVPVPTEATDEDVVVLLNGDILRGYVLSVSPVVSIEVASGVVDVRSDRLAGLVLANPVEPASGTVVVLNTGSVIHAASISTDGVTTQLTSFDGWSFEMLVSEVRGLLPMAGTALPLAVVEPSVVEPLGERLYVEGIGYERHASDTVLIAGATLGLSDVVLDGPMRVRYDVPGDARVFVATLGGLDGATWGDGSFAVLVDGVEWLELPVEALESRRAVRVDVAGASELILEVRPGALGGVRAGAQLHRPLFVID